MAARRWFLPPDGKIFTACAKTGRRAGDGVPLCSVRAWGPSLGPLWGGGSIRLTVMCISIREIPPDLNFTVCARYGGKILPPCKITHTTKATARMWETGPAAPQRHVQQDAGVPPSAHRRSVLARCPLPLHCAMAASQAVVKLHPVSGPAADERAQGVGVSKRTDRARVGGGPLRDAGGAGHSISD